MLIEAWPGVGRDRHDLVAEKFGRQGLATRLLNHAMAARPASTVDVAAIGKLDAEAFGTPRADLLTRLPAFTQQLRVIEGTDGILGYGGAWRNVDTTVIGPVVAANTDIARTLIEDLAAGTAGPTRLDIDHTRPELLEWAEGLGIAAGFTTTVMVRGEDLPGDRDRYLVPAMVAIG